ncbi:GGDEF domain-containing protein [Vibrio cholerae]|uniref:GGDEF domain-containing protein n=1 Tax=Vibrio cholerae TaxID=666 RepID=UPI0011F02967|nr:GGDEF domain-containing protein [Vibrio cholerae]ELY5180016.1 GGDEF domain-containing protein [Vibrio cholerae]TYW35834.1 GGDEF domain-containing protein [Vibrio cholerae]TYW43779.1 GGDEF domain-containing protein [Vibrio cholerae]
MIIVLIEKWLSLNRWHDDFRDSSFIFFALLFLTLIFSFFLYYNIFIVPFPFMILIDAVGLLGSLVGLWALKNNRKPRLAGLIGVIAMTVVSLLYIESSGATKNEEFALGFTLAVPVISIFVLGYQLGTLFSLLNFCLVFCICFQDLAVWDITSPETIGLVHLAVIYLTLFAIAFFYDSGRRHTLHKLQQTNLILKKLSTTDILTKLPNRLFFEELVNGDEEFFWIAIIDIDDFKKINDTFGHDKGDDVLQMLAIQITSSIGVSGVACRWGGEEFMIAFSIREIELVEKIITQLQRHLTMMSVGFSATVTVSCGIAAYQPDNYKSSFKQADSALYLAKQSGKNTYKVYPTKHVSC